MLKDLKVALFLGYKSIIKGNKATAILMVFILSLAFINQVFIGGVLNGIIDAIDKQIINNMVSNVVIDPQEEPAKKDIIPNAAELQSQIETIPGVAATARIYKLSGTISYDKKKDGKPKILPIQIMGVNPDEGRKISDIPNKIIEGGYLEGLGDGDMVLGASIAGGYKGTDDVTTFGGVKIGDTVKVIYNNGIAKDYKVRGIYRVKFDMADMMGFVTAKESESVLSTYDSASQILVKIDKDSDEDKYIGQIQAMAPNLKVRKWSEYMGGLGGINKSFGIISLIISSIGIAVAGITIFILIYINAVNKRRQIGILKAIGINENIIICSYVFQALFYSVTGTLIGLLLTMFAVVPYFAVHPIELPIGDSGLLLSSMAILYACFSMIIAGLVAGFIPSWQTARENILKAIWGA